MLCSTKYAISYIIINLCFDFCFFKYNFIIFFNIFIFIFFAEYYKFWLKSIDSFSDTDAPVVVVGTRADKLSKDVSSFEKKA